jgi:acetyl-CoA carboxylase biotin carboxyl carrier protein
MMKTAKKSSKSPSGGAARQRALTRAVEDAVTEAIRNGQPAGAHAGASAVLAAATVEPSSKSAPAALSAGGLHDVQNIRELARVVAEFDIAELELEVAGDRLRLRRGQLAASPAHAAVAVAPPSLVQSYAPPPAMLAQAPAAAPELISGAAGPAAAPRAGETFVTSPFVGTFYRAPSPEAPPFAEVGTLVKKGQPLCIVEAMKLMNEIEAEHDGRITAVLAQNGQPVEYGEKLFSIEVQG